jgi:hypothetical protein
MKKKINPRVIKHDEILYSFEKDIEALQSLAKKLKKTQKKFQQLVSYMETDWLEDYDNYHAEKGLHVLGQDYFYNAMLEYKELQKKILIATAKGIS